MNVSTVNWNEIFTSNKNDVVEFASGTLSLRNFKKRCSGVARREVLSLEKTRGTLDGRRLARRACKYRSIAVFDR